MTLIGCFRYQQHAVPPRLRHGAPAERLEYGGSCWQVHGPSSELPWTQYLRGALTFLLGRGELTWKLILLI